MRTFRGWLSLALLTLPAPGQLAVGTDAPTIAFTDTVNAPLGMRELADLRGAVILVEFWATWCGPCRAQIPRLRTLHDTCADRGLVVVSVAEEPAATVRPFAEQNGMTWPVAVAEGAMKAWQVRGVPHAFLIGPDGKIAWTGHPGALQDKNIELLLATAISPLQKLTEQLAPVQDLLDRGQRGKALAMLLLLERGGKLSEPSRARAAMVGAALQRQVESIAAAAKDAEGPFARALLLRELVDEWQGRSEVTMAAAMLAELEKANAADVQAASATRRAQQHFARHELDAAAAAWNEVLATSSEAGRALAEAGLTAIEARRKASAK
ncbi:MAG: TlpA family protein disulfide reductase [Planctomycetes bacterium]|nr:TlpA family protein disulfide reductase [Planctomycetota bacterium]